MRYFKLFALTLSLLATMPAYAGSEGGNGGGGVKIFGRHMTFYTAGLYTEPRPAVAPDLDSLKNLLYTIDRWSFLSDTTRADLLLAVQPSISRTYYKVKEDQFSKKTMAGLLAEFHRATQVPIKGLHVYALTDTNTKTTFLLPEFDKLSQDDQEAILFHEAYWLLHPKADYKTVIAAEMAFQAVREQPSNVERTLLFLDYLSLADSFAYSIQQDIATGALQDGQGSFLQYEQSTAFAISDLLGFKYGQCGKAPGCKKFVMMHFLNLRKQYPRSLFLRFVEAHHDDIWVQFNGFNDVNFDGPPRQRVSLLGLDLQSGKASGIKGEREFFDGCRFGLFGLESEPSTTSGAYLNGSNVPFEYKRLNCRLGVGG